MHRQRHCSWLLSSHTARCLVTPPAWRPHPPPVCSQGACLEVNFGQEAFQWDPASLVQQEQALQAEALSRCSMGYGRQGGGESCS